MSMPCQSPICTWGCIDGIGQVYTPRTGHVVAKQDGVFYLFGGTDGVARQSDVHAYNIETNLWQAIRVSGRIPTARSGAQAVIWGEAVWFFGGYTKKDGVYFNDVYKYHLASSVWSFVQTCGDIPQTRTDHSVVLIRDSMLVFGGFDGHNRFNDLRQLHLRDRRWSLVTNSRCVPPRRRFGHTAVVYGSSMYIFGGWDGHDTLQELLEYNVSSNTWVTLQPDGVVPRARYRHTAVVCGDGMFTFGGVDKSQYRFPDLHEYNFTSRCWRQVSPSLTSTVPSPRTFHRALVHDGSMYILGGFDGRRLNDMYKIQLRTRADVQKAANRPENLVSNSDPQLGAIGDAQDQACAHMPEDLWTWQRCEEQHGQVYTPRTGHAVVVWNHCFYLMGGTDENARQNDVYRFDVRTSIWHLIDNVCGETPSARSGSKTVVCRDSIFYFGGYTKKDGDYFNDLFEFNIPNAHWTHIDHRITDDRVAPSNRTDHSCVAFEADLWIFGGFDGKSRFQDLHRYNIDDKDWFEMPSAENGPKGRFGHSAVMYRERMVIFGGWNGHDTLSDLYEFSMTTHTWYGPPGRGEVPPSRYRHSAAVHGCCMFVFGGVDKRQARFSDLYEFNLDTMTWSLVKVCGDPPTARTFHRAVMYGGNMFILGGFDGCRRNDMYKIAIPDTQPRGERDSHLRRRRRSDRDSESEEVMVEPSPSSDLACGKVEITLRHQVRELQRRLMDEMDRHLCKICFEREINTVILNCNHRAVCTSCADQMQPLSCPVCRATIVKITQTYDP